MHPLVLGDVPAAIARIARPIHGDDELDQLLDLVGHARVLLLGGASHGARELYELRAALTRKLVAQRGYAAVAIAGDWPDALRIDRYVRGQGDDESAEAALEGFARFPTWTWRNAEVARLVEWLRGYNRHRQPEERAGFYGLDLYALHASSRAALSYLDEVEPVAAARARARYACFDHAAVEPRPGALARLRLAEEHEEEIIDQLIEMQRRRTARSGRAPSGDAWFQTFQTAHTARGASAYYRALVAGHAAAWNLREEHMADTLDLLASQLARGNAPAKLVVWAHNAHVGDARATAAGAAGQITLGQLLRERHPGELALVGFTTYEGSVECAPGWDEPAGVARLPAGAPGSWEALFHATGIPRFMVTASALRRVAGERAERLHRAIGAVYRPDDAPRSGYVAARLADQYDLIVHVDATRAVELLPRPDPEPAESAAPRLPESYPRTA